MQNLPPSELEKSELFASSIVCLSNLNKPIYPTMKEALRPVTNLRKLTRLNAYSGTLGQAGRALSRNEPSDALARRANQ